MRVVHRSYGHRPFGLHFTKGGATVALAPLVEVASRLTGRRGVCLPFADFCGPLWFEGGEAAVVHALLADFARSRRWHYYELRGAGPGCCGRAADRAGWHRPPASAAVRQVTGF